MSFCQTVWEDVAPLRRAILDHPFLNELAAGTLAPESFRHYIVQDSLYLAEYSRALALAAARAPTASGRLEFSDGAKVAVQVEEALHQAFFAQFGVTAEIAAASEPTPACLGYTSYLSALAATRSYEELIAGILPCFWVYWEVGCDVKPRAASPNPYAAWIDTYAAPAFGEATDRVRALVDEAAQNATAATRAAMVTAFRNATRFEWMFWDSAYYRAIWPI
ncbi:thiaminase II [Novosphingobium resinovorum]|uniref:thiaminase II n=1 Tax=Sphingomonadaceae TaxID=41297 RepID=UPI00027CAF05|nr:MULTISPECIES: thiaminase II [Sphingomonadaceae]EJU09580.1 TenA family transcriptional regulator [Sphingomonas sp. LH128]MBF7012176.1 thiaminase II [Novosphingobium sp. HR1a]WJM26923.1 thiaminase II [Novosphingobium resinovorum]